MVRIEINFTNKWLYFVLGLGVVFATGFVVLATTYNSIPNPGHGADQVEVLINGNEMTLQQAIDKGEFRQKGRVLLDEPYNVFSGIPQKGGTQGTIDVKKIKVIPDDAKEILLYGNLDSGNGALPGEIKYKWPGQKKWKYLVHSQADTLYPNTNSLWVPLDEDGKLSWYISFGQGIQDFSIEIHGYAE